MSSVRRKIMKIPLGELKTAPEYFSFSAEIFFILPRHFWYFWSVTVNEKIEANSEITCITRWDVHCEFVN